MPLRLLGVRSVAERQVHGNLPAVRLLAELRRTQVRWLLTDQRGLFVEEIAAQRGRWHPLVEEQELWTSRQVEQRVADAIRAAESLSDVELRELVDPPARFSLPDPHEPRRVRLPRPKVRLAAPMCDSCEKMVGVNGECGCRS